MIITQPDRCAEWANRLSAAPVPVLAATAALMATWREQPDRVDAHSMADAILCDPLMTLRVLVCIADVLGNRLETPVETVTAGLVHIGIEPFFARFTDLPVLEDLLWHQPEVLAGALQDMHDAHRAARLAAAIAIERQDEDAELLHQAALLANFASLLLWCEEPGLALEMQRRQRIDRHLRSPDVQRAVLGAELIPLEHMLIARWGLPGSLRRLLHAGHSAPPGPQSVALAVRIARHSRDGWDNAALPDDFIDLGRLLNIPAEVAAAFVYTV